MSLHQKLDTYTKLQVDFFAGVVNLYNVDTNEYDSNTKIEPQLPGRAK